MKGNNFVIFIHKSISTPLLPVFFQNTLYMDNYICICIVQRIKRERRNNIYIYIYIYIYFKKEEREMKKYIYIYIYIYIVQRLRERKINPRNISTGNYNYFMSIPTQNGSLIVF